MKVHDVSSWVHQKLSGAQATIRKPRVVTREFKKITGPRTLFASVTLSAEPAQEFKLSFVVEPSERDYRAAIEDAILSELLSFYTTPVLRVSVQVLEVQEDEVGSCYRAFRQAASDAIQGVLVTESGDTNIVWPNAL